MLIEYDVSKPVSLVDHFDVPVDTSPWEGEYIEVLHKGGRKTQIPLRGASMSFKELLTPKTDIGQDISGSFGIYLLFFRRNNTYYPGIASMHAKQPEGILNRIRKHRAKATATVHSTHTEINHTRAWRKFAVDRWTEDEDVFSTLEDCVISICKPRDHANIVTDEKKYLEAAEKNLTDIYGPVFRKFVDSEVVDWNVPITCLARTNRGKKHDMCFHFWDRDAVYINERDIVS